MYGDGSSSSSIIKSLDDTVEQDGSNYNYSAGQRQLLIIGRALLDGASVVICDEATSSIDAEADSRIQRVFRTDFEKSTTLTVAHRLNTILNSTHILVINDGKTVEFDSPRELLPKVVSLRISLTGTKQNCRESPSLLDGQRTGCSRN